tara:strand:+ start:799 stop:975 length:177 start_codon:yes stop_codon:yes gene_type:complete
MKVGDLIKLKQHCKDSDRWATIVAAPFNLHCVKIMYLDNGEIVSAIKSNVTVISKSEN